MRGAIVALMIGSLLVGAKAEDSEPIRIGMSAAMSGPAQSLGLGMKLGVEAYFQRVNRNGGVDGRRLELIAMDDGYEPESAVRNMNHLVDDEGVLAMIGNVGTPTAKLTVPIAIEKRTLLFGAFTGAGLLRKPPSRYVVNYRASYAQETAAMVEGLLAAGIMPYEIAIFSQNDSYGDAGYSGVVQGLRAVDYRNGDKLPHGRYERNTVEVEDGLLTILESPVQPKAIVLVGAYAACAKFIRLAKRALPDTIFLNVSFVGSMALKNALGADGEGVIVTQVVPHFGEELPLTEAYRQDLEAYDPESLPGFVSLEGYIVAKIFVEGLRRIDGEIGRESIVDALLGIKTLDIGLGTVIDYGTDIYQGSQKVWPTAIREGQFRSVDLSRL
jgi:branched-chain amino acid transport system substrate-binding protein